MAEEGLAVGEVGVGLTGVGGGIVPSAFAQLLFRALFELAGFCEKRLSARTGVGITMEQVSAHLC